MLLRGALASAAAIGKTNQPTGCSRWLIGAWLGADVNLLASPACRWSGGCSRQRYKNIFHLHIEEHPRSERNGAKRRYYSEQDTFGRPVNEGQSGHSMSDLGDECATAVGNLRDAVYFDRRFPLKVFSDGWLEFFFFDSDWMFDDEFAEKVKATLAADGGGCACLIHLDSAATENKRDSPFFIDQRTLKEAYRSFLEGSGPPEGLIYQGDRFACISDAGNWCIYSERRSEIGVIALRLGAPMERYMPLIEQLKAAPIREAVELQISYGFSPKGLSELWRASLIREYQTDR
jgi:hypothetical protein